MCNITGFQMKVHVQIGKLLDDLSVVFATNAKHILQSI